MITGIITAPRGIGCISHTIESMLNEGIHDIHVFAEPGVKPYYNQTKVHHHQRQTQHGVVDNWFAGLQFLLDNFKDEWFLMCEDDAYWRRGAYDTLLQGMLDHSDCGYLSPYCCYLHGSQAGWHKPKFGNAFFGSLSICLPRKSAEYVITHEEEFKKFGDFRYLDFALGELFIKFGGMDVFVHGPTLITHIGEESTLWNMNQVNRYPLTRAPYEQRHIDQRPQP